MLPATDRPENASLIIQVVNEDYTLVNQLGEIVSESGQQSHAASSTVTKTEPVTTTKKTVTVRNIDTTSLASLLNPSTLKTTSLEPFTVQLAEDHSRNEILGCILNEEVFGNADPATRYAWAEQCKNIDIGCQFNGNNCRCGNDVCNSL